MHMKSIKWNGQKDSFVMIRKEGQEDRGRLETTEKGRFLTTY